jgi:hypothetical protein
MIRHTRTAISLCRDIERELSVGAPPYHANLTVFAEVARLPSRNVSRSKKAGQILDSGCREQNHRRIFALGVRSDRSVVCVQITRYHGTDQGRKSVDAIFCVLVITGALIGGADFVTGRVGTAAWWSSVAVIAVNLLLCVICLLKGKVVTGVTGVVISVVALPAPSGWPSQGLGGRRTAMPAGCGAPGAPRAATASVTRSAGTAFEISSPAPPPRKGRLTAPATTQETCPPPPDTTPGNGA